MASSATSPRSGLQRINEDEDMDDPLLMQYDDIEIEEVVEENESSTDQSSSRGRKRFTIEIPSNIPLEDIYGVTPNSPREDITGFQVAFESANMGSHHPSNPQSSTSPYASSPFNGNSSLRRPGHEGRLSAVFTQDQFESLAAVDKEQWPSIEVNRGSLSQTVPPEEESTKVQEMVSTHFGFVNDVTPKWALSLWLSQNADTTPELPFQDVLLAPDLILATALCRVVPVTEADEVAKSLVRVFQRYDDSIRLIKIAVKREVAVTESGNTLFRSNSMSCKLLSQFSRMVGSKYLDSVLRQHLNTICSRNITLEIDPYKLKDPVQVEANVKELKMWSQAFLDSIVCSINECPQPFRIICHHLKTEVCKRFPEKKYIAISSFIFLRFFCPAIVAPHAFGITKKPPPEESQRTLVLISKVLQNLANGTEFGSKEAWMTEMNSFIIANDTKMKDFCALLGSTPTENASREEVRYAISKPIFEQCMDHLATCIDKFTPQISRRIGRKRIKANVSYRTMDRLHASMQHSKKVANYKVKVTFPDPFPGMNVEPLSNLVDMLFCPGRKILTIVVDNIVQQKRSPRVDSVLTSLFKLFQSNGQLLILLKIICAYDIAKNGSSLPSLMSGSITLSMLMLSLNWEGKGYLQSFIAPVLDTMISSGNQFIIDQNAGETSTSTLDLLRIIQSIVDQFLESDVHLPGVLKHVLAAIFRNLSRKFGLDEAYNAISTAFITNFICPALSSPEAHGVTKDAVTKNCKRGLAMTSKILLNITSKKHYKEVYMSDFNTVIDQAIPKLDLFIRRVTSPAEDTPSLSTFQCGLGELMEDAHAVYSFIADNYSDFIRILEDDETDLTVSYNFMEVVTASISVYKTRIIEKQRKL
eukprot:TRINITY_DN3574_c0_g1_i5.p1 TRINITY_DN3574_c0_g1~~TRINITY_DN3574_c0_g1_i5.p1  ORF type:complete len:871 (+),score=139.07 TRINITY_DN3574_c0_g1_i5:51-2663(+)